jgi:hypothetical protein
VISEYFREKSSLFVDENRLISNEINNEDFPSVDFFVDRIDVDMMSFLINQTNDIRRSTTPPPLSTIIEDLYLINEEINPIRKSKKFSWIPFTIGVGIAVGLILLIIILFFFISKHKNRSQFKA